MEIFYSGTTFLDELYPRDDFELKNVSSGPLYFLIFLTPQREVPAPKLDIFTSMQVSKIAMGRGEKNPSRLHPYWDNSDIPYMGIEQIFLRPKPSRLKLIKLITFSLANIVFVLYNSL